MEGFNDRRNFDSPLDVNPWELRPEELPEKADTQALSEVGITKNHEVYDHLPLEQPMEQAYMMLERDRLQSIGKETLRLVNILFEGKKG